MKMMTDGRDGRRTDDECRGMPLRSVIVAVFSFSILLLRYKEVTSA